MSKIDLIRNARSELEVARLALKTAQRNGDYVKASELRYSTIPKLQSLLPQEGSGISNSGKYEEILHDSVAAADIEAIVFRRTGIPITRLMSGEVEKLVQMEDALHQSIKGQGEALTTVSNAVRTQRAGLSGDNRPIASCMILGPTGVGKTATCKMLANLLFSTQNAIIRFDMSEFEEKHTTSRSLGSPAGYVGYEDAEQLTEAVRRKPYAIVLFDEFEKSRRDIASLLV